MAFPERLLAADEEVVVHVRPHWKVLIWPVIAFVLVVGLAGFGAAYFDVAAVQIGIAVVAVIAICYLTVRPFLRWLSTHFVVTTHRVLIREGVLSRSGRDVALSRINDVSFEHTLLERMFGCGTLTVESAGERGQVVLRDIPDVEYVQGTLYRLIEEDSDRRIAASGVDDDGTGHN